MTVRDASAERAAGPREGSLWVTRLSRQGERRLYFFATVILLVVWAVTRLL